MRQRVGGVQPVLTRAPMEKTATDFVNVDELNTPEELNATGAEELVAVSDAVVAYNGKRALTGVTIAVHRNEIVTLIGPNGAGKTTLARVFLGLTPLTSGVLRRKPSLRVGYVPQRFPVDRIIPLSVARFMRVNGAGDEAFIAECLNETGALALVNAQLADLSGGEFQRVLLARALARKPDLLVLDEPAQAVDFAGAAALYELIDTVRKRRGCGILLISHDLHVVLGASNRVVCLNRHICCEGVPQVVAGHPEYIRLFGRDAASLGLYRHTHDHSHTLSGDVACS